MKQRRLKVGDQVRRINAPNYGGGARVGQAATIREIEGTGPDKMLFVEYAGCLKEVNGYEGWAPYNVERIEVQA